MTIHTPYLTVLKYTGDFDKKLFEVKTDRTFPLLKNGDFVIVNKLDAALLKKRAYFIEVDICQLFVNENESSSFVASSLTDEQIEGFIKEYSEAGKIVAIEDFNNVTSSLEKISTFLQEKMPYEFEDAEESIENKVIRLLGNSLTSHEPNTTNIVLKEVVEATKQEDTTTSNNEINTSSNIPGVNDQKNTEDQKMEVYKPPFKEDLETLSEEDIKFACTYFNIPIGNKKIATLKSLLLAHLESKEVNDSSK